MARKYEYHTFDETCQGMKGLTRRFGYEQVLFEKTNIVLMTNFLKCAQWVEENCPNLNGEFSCYHEPYHWTKLVVEDGKAYLEYGSHGWDFSIALSRSETAVFSRGSQQSLPYAFNNCHFFRNDALEEFLSQWGVIKERIICANRVQTKVFSEDFVA